MLSPREVELTQELAERLIGTPDISDPPEFGEWSDEMLNEFAMLAFACAACGWWCSIEELNEDDDGDALCDECERNVDLYEYDDDEHESDDER